MSVVVLPDIEKLVIDWALATPQVAGQFGGTRIYSALPENPAVPAARVVRFGGFPPQRLHWLDQASMQIDVWGGPKATARLAAATFAACLSNSLVGPHPLGVVTAVECAGPRWEPDVSYTPARPRYVVQASIWFHP